MRDVFDESWKDMTTHGSRSGYTETNACHATMKANEEMYDTI